MIRTPVRRSPRKIATLLLTLYGVWLLCQACSEEAEPLPQSSLERPERIAFACFDTDEQGEAVSPRPMQECASENGRVLYALVTQTSRGEVAAVNLSRARVMDSRSEVPGYTFVPVGEIPKGIAVPAAYPQTTYVANFGSRDLTVISTRAFLPGASTGETIGKRTPLTGGPVDMVLSPAEDALFLAIPDTHSVVRLSLCRDPRSQEQGGQPGCLQAGDEGAVIAVEQLRLPAYSSQELLRIKGAVAPPETAEPYAYACGYTFSEPESTFERYPALTFSCASPVTDGGTGAAGAGGTEAPAAFDRVGSDANGGAQPDGGIAVDVSCHSPQPRPVALAVQGYGIRSARLLVADSALPVIHLIELDAFAEYASGQRPLPSPWVVGVPVRDVVVTPPVPIEIPVSIAPSESEPASEPDAGEAMDTSVGFDAGTGAEAGATREGGTGTLPDGGDQVQEDAATGPSASGNPPSPPSDAGADASASGSGPPGGSSGSPLDISLDYRQYAYAIDAIDGSVMAIDAMTGAVLLVNTAGARQPDRIPLPYAVGTSLEIITPGFEPGDGFVSRCKCARAERVSGINFAPAPRELQGVFLAVASRSGGIYLVDIHDKRAVDLRECRHSECLDEQGALVIDEDDGRPAPELKDYYAESCTVEDRCRRNQSVEEFFWPQGAVALDSENCRTCCDEQGERFDFEVNEACFKCRDPQGELIEFDRNRCRRCLDQEGNPVVVGIRRHRPRIADVLTRAATESIVSFIVGGMNMAVKNSGSTEALQAHSLCRIDCNNLASMGRSFPDPDWQGATAPAADEESSVNAGADAGAEAGVDAAVQSQPEKTCAGQSGDAFVCVGTDPWRANGEKWQAGYEGKIPGSFNARGRFVLPADPDNLSGRLQLWGSEGDYCDLGVLGAEQQAPRPGDMLVILPEALPGSTIEYRAGKDPDLNPGDARFVPADCNALTEQLEDETVPRVALPIARSFSDHLELEEKLIADWGPVAPSDLPLTYELVRYCTGGLPVSYEIRSRQSYIVVGETSGFLHGVCAGPDGLCGACDATYPAGRAYEDEVFDNGVIAFRLARQKNRDPSFALEIRPGSITKVSVDLGNVGSYYYTYGTLPVELRYEPVNGNLFAVDQVVRGLVRIPLQPFPSSLLGATYIF